MEKERVYVGYGRTSTKKQKLESQIDTLIRMGCEPKNIYTDQFTGKGSAELREGWQELRKDLKGKYTKGKYEGKQIVLCVMSVNRMSRDKESGVREYFEIINEDIIIQFDMDRAINSEMFGEKIRATGDIKLGEKTLDETLGKGLRDYMVALAKQQIEIAFEQAEKEAEHIREKVQRGLAVSGKKSGREKGYISTKKKNIPDTFEKDYKETQKVAVLARLHGVSRPTIYSWIKEINK